MIRNKKGEVESEAFATLGSGYKKLVDLARNFYDSNEKFNLMESINAWDEPLFKVYEQAVLLRKEK